MPLYRLREDDPIATLGELNARPTATRCPRLQKAPPPRKLRLRVRPARKRAA